MQLDARAFWVVAPGRGEIRGERLAPPGPDEVLVRTLYSGVSRGTESLVFAGRVPHSEWETMRAPFQDGHFGGAVKYGYCNVGIVEDGNHDLAGRVVFALFPHQDRYVAPSSAVHVVPDSVPASRAILAANMETAINALWDARPHVGDRIAVIGAGTVGCLVAWLAGRLPGTAVELIDINPRRAAVAEALGVHFAVPDKATPAADVIFHASGSAEGLQLALRIAAFEATITELSWFGDKQVVLPLGESFHARRLTIASSQVGTVAASQRRRWTTQRRMQLALGLLADPALDVLITGESDFYSLPETMATLASTPGDALCHRVRYGER